jgi:hypothetical protein
VPSKFSAGDTIKTSPWAVTAVVSVLGAVVAATPAIYASVSGKIAKERELAISAQKQEFDTRMAFLDRAIDSTRPLEVRQQVLRFLVAVTTQDQAMKQWAKDELDRVDEGLRLKEENRKLQQAALNAAEDARKARDNERKLQAEFKSLSSSSAAEKLTLRSELGAAVDARRRAEVRLATAEAKVVASSQPTPTVSPLSSPWAKPRLHPPECVESTVGRDPVDFVAPKDMAAATAGCIHTEPVNGWRQEHGFLRWTANGIGCRCRPKTQPVGSSL